jgi:hypothetical protein
MVRMKDYHKILDLPRPFTVEQLRGRYKQLIRIYHPDRFTNPVDKAYAEERLKLINEAYAALAGRSQPDTPSAWDAPPTDQAHARSTDARPHTAAAHVHAPLAPLWRRVGLPILTYALFLSGLAMTPLLTFSPFAFTRLWYSEVVGLSQQRSLAQAAQPLTPHHTPIADWVPIVSANGQRFAFVLNQGGSEQLYIRDPRSGQLRQVSHDASHKRAVVWSPDGNQLAFLSSVDAQATLYVFNLTTVKLTTVSAASELNSLSNLRWAADSLTLLGDFQRNQQPALFQVNLE